MDQFIQTKIEMINGKEVVVQVYPPQGRIPKELMPGPGENFRPRYAQKKPDLVPPDEFCNWNDDALYC